MKCSNATGWCGDVRNCQRCWLMTYSANHRRNWGVAGPPDPHPVKFGCGRGAKPLPVLPPCELEGPVREFCKTCGPQEDRNVRTCYHDANPTETCTRQRVSAAVWACERCQHHTGRLAPPAPVFEPRPGDPPVGVVIGFSRWPALIDLQLALIRETCGPVPVLVSADPDPQRPDDVPTLAAVCRRQRAELIVSPERIGHTGGDLAAFGRGVTWGASRGLKVVAKLSQRFLIARQRWLQDGAAELLLSGLPAAARFAAPTPPPNAWGKQLRTEVMLLDVARWNTPDVPPRLSPRKRFNDRPGGYHAEDQILDLIRGQLGGAYWPWDLVAADRYAKSPGVVWRMANGREDYDAIARRFGITLPPDFKVAGWEAELRKGEYDRG
jgi:hypothetical protein